MSASRKRKQATEEVLSLAWSQSFSADGVPGLNHHLRSRSADFALTSQSLVESVRRQTEWDLDTRWHQLCQLSTTSTR